MIPGKKFFAQEMYAVGLVKVFFHPQVDGVLVPEQFHAAQQIAFDYDHRFVNPSIPDMDFGEEGISATLSFSGTPFKTFVPWKAVCAVVSEEVSVMWPIEIRAAGAQPVEQPAVQDQALVEAAGGARRERPAWMKVV